MAKSNHITNSFIAGEISPKAFGRSEIQQYNSAVEKSENFIIYPQGGAGRRPGTIFKYDIVRPDGTYPTNARLIPFSASDGTRWQILITKEAPHDAAISGYYGWKAIDVSGANTYNVVPDFGPTISWQAELNLYDLSALDVDLNEIQYAQLGDILILSHPLFRPLRITYDTTAAAVFIASMFGVSIVDSDKWKAMPFLDQVLSNSDESLAVTTVVSNGTIAPGAGSALTFSNQWVGRIIQFTRTSTDTMVVLITGFNSGTSLDWELIGGSPPAAGTITYGSNTTETYKIGAWDDILGWPRTVAYFEQRLLFGGTKTFPDTGWMSQLGDVYEFVTTEDRLAQDTLFGDPVVATDPFVTNLNSNSLQQIRWLLASKSIAVGTSSKEFIVEGPDNAQSIGALNIGSHPETEYGSAYVQAVKLENVPLYIDKSRRVVRELVFNFDEDSFKSPNMNILAEHIASARLGDRDGQHLEFANCNFVAMAAQQSSNILWCIDNNGYLSGMTREREQQVIAWHRHKLAGTANYNGVAYDPFIRSISCVPKPADASPELGGEYDELWMVVQRPMREIVAGVGTEQDVLRLFVERMSFNWEHPDISANWDSTSATLRHGPVYMDCSIIFDGSETDVGYPGTIQELPHGHDSVVNVLCNGRHLGQFTVSDGTIDISDSLTAAELASGEWQAIVGYLYYGDLIPVVPEVPAQLGTSQAQPRRIDQVSIHFYRTNGCKFGRAANDEQEGTPHVDLDEIDFPNKDNEDPVPLFTGERKVVFPQGYEARPKVRIYSHLPYPCVVTHLVSRMVVYEG